MSKYTELADKLTEVKSKVEGDLKTLIEKLEAIFQHVQASPVEDVVKTAVAEDVHAAATSVEHVADTLRTDADDADKAVDSVDTAVDNTATK